MPFLKETITLLIIFLFLLFIEDGEGLARCGKSGIPKCDFDQNFYSLTCTTGFPRSVLSYRNDTFNASLSVTLTLCHWTGYSLKANLIKNFPYLEQLTVSHSNTSRISGNFPRHLTIKVSSHGSECQKIYNIVQVLNFSSLYLEAIRPDTFAQLVNLKVLDLRNNQLKYLSEKIITSTPTLESIYLAGNPWNCSTDLRWLVGRNESFVRDLSDLICGQERFHAKPLVPIMNFAQTLDNECKLVAEGKCKCSLDHVVWSTEDYLIPRTTVNCSNLQLTSLPMNLPANTTVLLLQNNNITNLTIIQTDPTYHHVADIYLDNNLIENVKKLEGSIWLLNFRVFSLKSNKIKRLPAYAFDHAFERNKNASHVFLGNNPWSCDCDFIPLFKDLLAKHHTIIVDIDDIRCYYREGNDKLTYLIRDLSRSTVCREPRNFWLEPIDCLNVILSLIIIIIAVQFTYDYCNYKKTGKLPWIAMKLL